MRDFWRNNMAPKLLYFSKLIFAIVLALVAGSILLLCLGYSPIEVYGVMINKAITSFDVVLRRATILTLAGLAVAIPNKAGVLNMGGEGQIIMGALVAAIVGGMDLGLPAGVHAAVAVLSAALVGVVLAFLPASLSLYRGASESVVGIMMNRIIALCATWLVTNPFKGSIYSPKTVDVLETAQIADVGSFAFSWAYFITIAFCILGWFLLERTNKGLSMKAAGLNSTAASFQGINVKTMGIIGMLIGGAMAGVGGSFEILGGVNYYMDNYFTGFGYDGVAIAIMAGNNPIGVIFSGLFMAVIRIGSLGLSRKVGLTTYYINVLQGFLIAFLVVPYLADMTFGGMGNAWKWLKGKLSKKKDGDRA